MAQIIIRDINSHTVENFKKYVEILNNYSNKKLTQADVFSILSANELQVKKSKYDYLLEDEISYFKFINHLLSEVLTKILNNEYTEAIYLLNSLKRKD